MTDHLSFYSLYRLLRQHRKLAEKRHPLYEANKSAKWVAAITSSFVVVYLLMVAVLMALDANDSQRHTSLEYITAFLPIFLLIDFWVRFMAQQTPSQLIKPYVLLPVPKYACIDSFIIRSLFGWGNLTWFIMLVPYSLMSVMFSYGFLATVSFLLFYYLVFLANSQWYAIARTLTVYSILWWALPVVVSALLFLPLLFNDADYFFEFYASIASGMDKGNVLPHFIVLLVLVALVSINRRLQYASVWKEMGKTTTTKLKTVSKFAFLDQWGEIGEYIRLDIKSTMRNKNPRKGIITVTLVIVVLSLVISFTEIYDSRFMTNFWCTYNYVVYGGMVLARVMSYEANYIDALMVHKENILKLLTAKYYFGCALLLLPFVLMLPMVFVGKWHILMLISYGIFTAGVQHCMIMQIAVYNKQKMPLNEKFISKGGLETNYISSLISIGAFFLPVALVSLLEAFFDHSIAWTIMLVLGVIFIAGHKLWLRNIYIRLMARKYKLLEAYHT